MDAPIVTTTAGKVRGALLDGGIARFRSVPYAAPPEGPLRFAAPARAVTWDGVREAGGEPGPNAPQPPRGAGFGIDMTPVIGTGWRPGADYLTADVWTPDPGSGGLPVMVFVHGGAFVAGEASAPAYDGTALARAGVVLVAVNYRLGAEGFLPLPGGATNIGLRDQIAALTWVRENAAAFGGDPDLVTVFGESAGAISVGTLLGSPAAAGLFRRAIVQSGGAEMVRGSTDRFTELSELIAAELGVPATAEAFREVPFTDVVAAQGRVDVPGGRPDLREADGIDPGYGIGVFAPVRDEDVLPEPPLDALRAGASAGVDVLAGTNADEINLYFVPTGMRDAITAEQVRVMIGAVHPDPDALIRAAGDGTPGEQLSRLLTEQVFAGPTRRTLEAHTGRNFGYRFAWHSDACDGQLGACHACELPFVFGTLATSTGLDKIPGEKPPAELSDRMLAAWVSFASTGEPGWAPRDRTDPRVMRFDVTDAVVPEPGPFRG
ncbi:carboxylesterase/lipase family protein [Pseudonocardia endophytica]|uniref:Carboxylic ester hydrolase n=1 Tax=Pseudonocardia endophytica TaxID=401976 RepID=A0A4R1HW53_PSEEN|nr:carboxylesterase family protein [Pseudonocardia endophytica]TCK25681.1 para-nitrobenzyl esterase [Pseudonocardia endophytica]